MKNPEETILKENNIEIVSSIEKIAFGKEFKQSKIQEENRKVIIYYEVEEPIKEKSLSEKINSTNAGETIKLPNIYFYKISSIYFSIYVHLTIMVICSIYATLLDC